MGRVELGEGLSLDQLEALAGADRLTHAYALFDLRHFPERIRLITLSREGHPFAYLLVWHGDQGRSIVHWVGTSGSEFLEAGLPPPPFRALVPFEIVTKIGWPHPVKRIPVEFWVRRSPPKPPLVAPVEHVRGITLRRLGAGDRELLIRFVEGNKDVPDVAGLAGLDLSCVRLWGAVREENGPPRLLATAHCVIEIQGVWILSGAYTVPEARGMGLCTALTRCALHEASGEGVDCASYVRGDNRPAIAAYTAAGMRKVADFEWVLVGGEPSGSTSD